MKNFGARVAMMRNAKEMTQAQLAEKLGLAQSNIARYENGNSFPSIENLVKLADIFDCTTDWLLGRTDSGGVKVSYEDIRYEIRSINVMLERIKELAHGR